MNMSPEPAAGASMAEGLVRAQQGAQACQMGYHAWVPWLELPNGSYTTWCARPGCNHEESYDL